MAMRARISGEPGIDVSRVRLHRQRVEPVRDRDGVDPLGMLECLALAQSRIETRIAQLDAVADAVPRDVALDQRELERERRGRAAQPGQGFRLETLHVDLDK